MFAAPTTVNRNEAKVQGERHQHATVRMYLLVVTQSYDDWEWKRACVSSEEASLNFRKAAVFSCLSATACWFHHSQT